MRKKEDFNADFKGFPQITQIFPTDEPLLRRDPKL
ncbi:MAG: hypothetical protein ACI9NQ_001351 [Paracoccaceae bacterium]|jgi:hypothetical protein